MKNVVVEFKMKWGVPQCFVAIDKSYAPISATNHLRTNF